MKTLKKALALCMSLLLLMAFPVSASAAAEPEVPSYLIDENRTGSMTIYKYDLTSAEKDGIWDSSYVSTGVYDQAGVVDILGSNNTQNDLGNGEVSYGYAIKGVEFSYIKVADIIQFSESEVDGRTDDHVEVLYGIDKVDGADFLKAIGLDNGAERYTNADHLNEAMYFYQSDVLIDALAASLDANSTNVKNALEGYMRDNNAAAMPLTDSYGKTQAADLDLGLYLVIETSVPEMVVSTTDPFLVSVPMTSVNGTNATDGGTRWIYDICMFPKNQTGIPSLEKTLREQVADTGKNDGSASDITDGYAHTDTASAGDIIDYQIISTLPSITSESTYLSCYTFIDTLSPGLTYCKNDVVLSFYEDAACVDHIATWDESDGKFTVAYNTSDHGESIMTIEMTEAGLAEINASKAVYSEASMVNSGYSDCTLRITYQAAMDSDNSVNFGDAGNPNDVVMVWQRTSSDYYDTLVDDAHVYTYGLELTKLFSDGKGNYDNVTFTIFNCTDNYYVKAELNEAEGVYYVTDHVDSEADATRFVPVPNAENHGKVIVKGLEDDLYEIEERTTDSGYTLLRDKIEVEISQKESSVLCDIYTTDTLGLIQNDPRYALVQPTAIRSISQKELAHYLLTASAAIDGNDVTMLDDDGSENALAPLSIINTRGFQLPATGDNGTLAFTIGGILIMATAASIIVLTSRKKRDIR